MTTVKIILPIIPDIFHNIRLVEHIVIERAHFIVKCGGPFCIINLVTHLTHRNSNLAGEKL
jgi:hypothetical protein